RKYVDYSAPHGELGGLVHAIVLEIADAAHHTAERFRFDVPANCKSRQRSIECLWLRQHFARCLGRGDAGDAAALFGATPLSRLSQCSQARAGVRSGRWLSVAWK